MAKAKKSEADLTIEEKLERALVADWEQPYKVPENWCWVRMGKIGYTNIGLTYKPSDISEKGTIVLRSSNIQDGKIDYSDIVKVKVEVPENKMSKKGDILICARNGSKALVGKTAIIDKDGMSYGVFMAIYRSNYNRFIFHYLNSHYFRNIIDGDVGTTTINQVTQALIKDLPLPFPPLAEQQRMVERIERLFSKLDEVKENVQDVIDGFENRKSAILHKAFNGELTAKWRKENNVAKDSWITKKINQVCYPRAGYAFDSKKFTNAGYQIIRMGNLYGGKLDLNRNPVFVSIDDADEAVLRRALINDGDILITLTGTKYKRDYGYAVCIHNPANLLLNQRILCLTPNYNEIKTDYLLFYLQSDLFRNVFFSNETGGVNQGNVSSKFVENIEFDMPTLDEQAEISEILCNILGKEQQAKEKAEEVLKRIKLIKKSILARAFRGELGTNNPDEESSIELLKTVLSEDKNEKRVTKPKSKRVSIPVEVKAMLSNHLEKDILKLFYKAESNEVSIDDIMSVISNKFEIMDALKALEEKKLVSKKANGIYKLAR